MSLVLGCANPALQKVLLELCFSDETHNPAFKDPRLKILDQSLKDDSLSGEQLRVLPMLYRSGPINGLSNESVTKVAGIYKHTFCRNNLMLHRLGQVQTAFNQAGFALMIGLKGVPAIAYLQLGIGARPMADVDVLIPRVQERPEDALAILNGLGYLVKASGFRSMTLVSPENLELDLHWYMHDWALGQDLVDIVCERARPNIFGTQAFLVPCVEHHLAHTIAHGVLTKTLTYDARWVFDTLAVLMRTERLDINRFAEFANRVMAPQRIRDALTALATELPDSIEIDRAQLLRLRDAVDSNSKIISWLYQQTPTPNLPPEQLRGTPRLDLVKSMLIHHIWLPRYLRHRQDVSVLSYWRWLNAFPPLTHRQGIWQYVKKLFSRGPLILYRLLTQK